MFRLLLTRPKLIAAFGCALTTTGLALAQDVAKSLGLLEGHTEPVYTVAWTPDGTKIVTGGFDSTVRVWDAATRKEIKTLEGHTKIVLSVAVDREGKRIASGALDNTAKVWDMPGNNGPVASLPQNSAVTSVAVKPDGANAAVAAGKTVKIWDLAKNAPVRDLTSPADIVNVAFSPTGAQVATGDKSRTIRLWNPADGKEQGAIETPADSVLSLAYAPNGQILFSAGSDGVARSWSLPLVPLRKLDGDRGKSIVSSDGSTILSLDAKGVLRSRKAEDAAKLAEVADLGANATLLSATPDGRFCAIGHADRSVKVVNLEAKKVVATIPARPSPITAIQLTKDGAQVAIASADGVIVVGPIAQPKDLKTLKGHQGKVNCLVFDLQDGKRLISGGADKAIKVWDISTGKATQDLVGHAAEVVRLTQSRDGKSIASASADGAVKLWANAGGQPGATFNTKEGAPTALLLSPDGLRATTLGTSGIARLWEVATGRELQQQAAPDAKPQHLATSRDGKAIVLVGDEGKWTTWTPSALHTFNGHTGPIHGLVVLPNGSSIATSSADKSIRIFEVATGKEQRVLNGHADAVRALAVTKSGSHLVSGSADKTVKVWTPADGKLITTTKPFAKEATAIAGNSELKSIAVGLGDGSVKVLDLTAPANGKVELATVPASAAPIVAVSALPNGNLVTAAAENQVKVWTISGAGPRNLAGHTGQVYSVSFAPDGKTLVTGSSDAAIKIWDLAKSASIKDLPKAHAGVVYSVAITPKGDLLLSAGDDKLVKTWSLPDGKELRKSEGHGAAVYCLSIRTAGDLFATGSVDKTVRIWKVADGKEVKKLDGHPDDVYGVAFSPDGKRLASIGYAGHLIFWDVDAGKAIQHVRVAPNLLSYGLAWSPDGKQVAVAGSDNRVHLVAAP